MKESKVVQMQTRGEAVTRLRVRQAGDEGSKTYPTQSRKKLSQCNALEHDLV